MGRHLPHSHPILSSPWGLLPPLYPEFWGNTWRFCPPGPQTAEWLALYDVEAVSLLQGWAEESAGPPGSAQREQPMGTSSLSALGTRGLCQQMRSGRYGWWGLCPADTCGHDHLSHPAGVPRGP